jgi:hypothetical protein
MSGAGGYKRGAPIPGVRVLSKAQIKEELRKVSKSEKGERGGMEERVCIFECVFLHIRGGKRNEGMIDNQEGGGGER